MGLFSGGSFASSNKGSSGADPDGGRGRHKGGRAQITATSYKGRHMSDRDIKAAVKAGRMSRSDGSKATAANARAARANARAAKADKDDLRN